MEAYELAVKQLILHKKHLFIDPEEEATVIFEKSILRGHTIADCLIFSSDHLEVGVEIKTAHDTTKRLEKQLIDYTEVCDYVWLVIHDKQVKSVLSILDNDYFNHVGILTYVTVGDQLMPGIYREATYNWHASTKKSLDMLWSSELRWMANTVAHRNGTSINGYTRKKQYINYMIRMIGDKPTKAFLCNYLISHLSAVEKAITFYDFTP